MTSEARAIEERAANAWPAAVLQLVDGWRLRFGGTTRRTNSVLPHGGGRLELAAKLAIAEEWYARRGAKVMFQISPASDPAELDTLLEQHGYTVAAPTLVQTVRLATLPAAQRSPFRVSIAETFEPEWLTTYADAEQLSPAAINDRCELLRRIGPRTAFATVSDGATGVAVGLGVVERGWLGMFCIATRAPWRRRGAATAVVQALAGWGRRWGAAQAYLQVEARNQAATALYERIGFRTRYSYHYREAQPAHELR